jgi:gamma-glutamyltranspeptidase/glutathione hydrolase
VARYASLASDPAALDAAQTALAAGGSAVDAVAAGFFAAAGARRDVLLASAVMLVGGAGAGMRAFDGRAVQPGRGTARPRGALASEEVFEAAHVAVPRAAAMVLLAHGRHGRRTVAQVFAAGLAQAKTAGADGRAAALARLSQSGAAGLRRFDDAILRIAGVNAGGLITESDLETTLPADEPARILERTAATGESVLVAIETWAESDAGASHSDAEVVVAVDARGMMAALAFVPAGGLVVAEIESALPAVAIPVLRGKTRLQPGIALPIPRFCALANAGSALRVAVATTAPRGIDAELLADAAALRPVDTGIDHLAAQVEGSVLAAIGQAADARALSRTSSTRLRDEAR